MISLRKNLLFCIKNHQKIRTFVSVIQPRGSENRSTHRQYKDISVKVASYEKNIQCYSFSIQKVNFSSEVPTLKQLDYENYCAETLDELCDYFEELIESVNELAAADVVNKDGVLTVTLGSTHGTYVINKQSPNKQIWLSSPKSGPKRFDFVYAKDGNKNGYWFYKHTGDTLHELLDKELTEIVNRKTKFQSLAFGSRC